MSHDVETDSPMEKGSIGPARAGTTSASSLSKAFRTDGIQPGERIEALVWSVGPDDDLRRVSATAPDSPGTYELTRTIGGKTFTWNYTVTGFGSSDTMAVDGADADEQTGDAEASGAPTYRQNDPKDLANNQTEVSGFGEMTLLQKLKTGRLFEGSDSIGAGVIGAIVLGLLGLIAVAGGDN